MGKDLAESLLLYAVTDRRWLGENETLSDAVRAAISGGATMIQLREKDMTEDEFIEEARAVRRVCTVPLLINDNIRVCKESGADGVHLGREDMPVEKAREILGSGYIIGATAHNLSEAICSEEAGADYLGVGAAFGSSTKMDARRIISLSEYKRITGEVNIPVVAIGGITSANVEGLSGLGLAGVASVSAVFANKDIALSTRKFRKRVEDAITGSARKQTGEI
ncbi:MAG: thiamine phosphate synthase [Lachnospiraceae bacterium]|nr:thiamine phosphate synthase [Lachnospiraceae bacterium]